MPDDNNLKSSIFEIMKDLQPVAFLISVCMIIAAFYANPQNKVDGLDLTNILMAVLFFFFAYMGLFLFRKTNFVSFRYFGEVFLLVGVYYLFNAFKGITAIIDRAANPINGFDIFLCVASFILISTKYLLGKIKNEIIRDFCKTFWYLSFISFGFSLIAFYIYLKSWFTDFVSAQNINELFNYLFIANLVSFGMSLFFYSFEHGSRMMDLYEKKIRVLLLNINLVMLLGAISFSIIGTCLLIDTPFILFGVKIGLITVSILLILFIAGFCFTWYREIIARIDKSENRKEFKIQQDTESACVEPCSVCDTQPVGK